MSFDGLWSELLPVGRVPSGGYRRFAWTPTDHTLQEWFVACATARGLDLVVDRCGNQWAWWGNPDAQPGLVVGSHLDSVPDGGAFDGPLGVVSAFAALDALRAKGFVPSRPIGVVNFTDEEGARFGIACMGSRLLTGAMAPDRAHGLTDSDGVTMGDAVAASGLAIGQVGRDDETLRRIGVFVELHVEQGRGLVDLERPVAVADSIWPHGRWRLELAGEANHAGTTRLEDRHDPMLTLSSAIVRARESAAVNGCVATIGKLAVTPNGVNAIPSHVTAWLDARGPSPDGVRAVVADLTELAASPNSTLVEESWTDPTPFDAQLAARLSRLLDDAPIMATGAGHDAGILANAGIPAAMVFVRNPTGISHSPAEFAEPDDCQAGVEALATVMEELA